MYLNYRKRIRGSPRHLATRQATRQAPRVTWAPRVAQLASRQALSIDFSCPKPLERGSEDDLGRSQGRPETRQTCGQSPPLG